jgi:hypothetical protein
MLEHNPYHYDGTAESLTPQLPPSGALGICFKSFLFTLVSSIIIGWLINSAIIGAFMLFSFTLLIPITAYGLTFHKLRKSGISQLVFWLSAAPLAIFFGILICFRGPEENHQWVLGIFGLIG